MRFSELPLPSLSFGDMYEKSKGLLTSLGAPEVLSACMDALVRLGTRLCYSVGKRMNGQLALRGGDGIVNMFREINLFRGRSIAAGYGRRKLRLQRGLQQHTRARWRR